MPYIQYISKRFTNSSLIVISQAEVICAQYAAQGYDLTLRQLYYQFVSRDLIPNTQRSYKRLGSIINDARLAGELDWDYIVDRTRNLETLPHWETPSEVIHAAASSYHNDLWATQTYRPEVWIEKDALVGVIERVSDDNDVPYFSCRGYTSQSEVWGAGQRMIEYAENDQIPYIIHLGDHDPSGIDMTRDIEDRIAMFMGPHHSFVLSRIALNYDQVLQYGPPPNPTKLTDSRAQGYIDTHGYQSWELDALEPQVLTQLVQSEIDSIRDEDEWEEAVASQEADRQRLQFVARNWATVEDLAKSKGV